MFHLERTETGRWRFIDVSEEQERAMGEEASEQVLQEYGSRILPDGDRRVQQVKRVAFRLIRSAGLDSPENHGIDVLRRYGTEGHPKSSVNWRVFVIKAPEERKCIMFPGQLSWLMDLVLLQRCKRMLLFSLMALSLFFRK